MDCWVSGQSALTQASLGFRRRSEAMARQDAAASVTATGFVEQKCVYGFCGLNELNESLNESLRVKKQNTFIGNSEDLA